MIFNFFDYYENGDYIFIYQTQKRNMKMSFEKFKNKVNKYKFRIYLEYRCNFVDQVLINGYADKNYILQIEDVEEIMYLSDSE
jgi:hypothetical protein